MHLQNPADLLSCLKSGSTEFIGEDSWAIAALRNVTQKWRQDGKKEKQGYGQAEPNQIDINTNPGMDENQKSHLRLWNEKWEHCLGSSNLVSTGKGCW